jgi:hypothetical protein
MVDALRNRGYSYGERIEYAIQSKMPLQIAAADGFCN